MNQKTLKALEYDKIVEILKNMAKSTPAKEYFENLIPSTNLADIENELNKVDEGYRYVLKYGNPPTLEFENILPSLKKSKLGATLNPHEILQIGKVLKLSYEMRSYLSYTQDFSFLESMKKRLVNLKEVISRIDQTFLTADEILDTASPRLKEIRDRIRKLESRIRDELNSMIRDPKIQRFLQEPIITIRGEKLLLPVKAEFRNEVKGIVHDQSATGATLFVEPFVCVEISNQIRILKSQEKEEIERILQEISSLIASYCDEIETSFYALVELDIVFTKAIWAKEMNASKPVINTSGIINLKKARHPLIQKDKVVPIDIHLGKDFDVLIITGPNTGGKTVTLKTVGLFCLLCQSGIFIPADEGSELCIFQKIFADIGDDQSIVQSLSTFSAHMKNIIEITKNADDKTLVLLDEIGAGTDPEEGAALAKAILKYLSEKGSKVIATTHYGELKIFAQQEDRFENASCEFDVKTLKPTYRLLIGIPGRSNALVISSNLGLDKGIVEMARGYLSQKTIDLDRIINEMEQKRKEAEENLELARKLKLEAQALKAAYEEEKKRFETERERIRKKAINEAKEIVERAQYEIENLFKDLRKLAENLKEKEVLKELEEKKREYERLIQSISQQEKQEAESKTKKTLQNIRLGQKVYVRSFDAVGFVESLPDSKGNLTVQIGIMKLNVNISDIEEVEEGEKKVYQTTSKNVKLREKSVDLSIDVRGKTSDDAILDVDKYLDDAYTSGLRQVTIIHGKGTGVLRQAIRNFLKRHPLVKSFRDGTYGEGEQGVTIVELRD